ncbi:MAG: hypothetical protein FJ125_07300 [Deltaproteobacteria bacterium]|nr:hypothetical protein [Deltaproteobacteria bacterium]
MSTKTTPHVVCIVLGLLLLGVGARAQTAVPRSFNHEGLLLDEQGLLWNGNVTLTFSIYDGMATQVALWSEVYQLNLIDGYYTVYLGEQDQRDWIAGSGERFLAIAVEGTELGPRRRLASVPYALVARDAVGAIHPASITVAAGGDIRVGGKVVIDSTGSWRGEAIQGQVNGYDTPEEVLAALNSMAVQPLANLNADKLDGLHESAFALADPDDLLAILNGHGGHLSGLDADLLDGLESGKFVRVDQNGAIAGTLTTAALVAQGEAQAASLKSPVLKVDGTANPLPACAANSEGQLRYNASTKVMQYCNSYYWVNMGPSPVSFAGADGALDFAGTFNLNADGSNGRAQPDGVAYRVAFNPADTEITLDSSPLGIAGGDLVLLINLQGSAASNADVGNWELLKVLGTEGSKLRVETAPAKSYNSGNFASQVVVVQRVPQYTSLLVASGELLTAGAWDRMADHGSGRRYTGIVAFQASVGVNVQAGGRIGADLLGFRGGRSIVYAGYNERGETYCGTSGPDNAAYYGGGGGGWHRPGYWSGGGGGGGYGSAGEKGYTDNDASPGRGGETYGVNTLAKVFLGSGGGGGSENCDNCYTHGRGGHAGGIVMIWAKDLSVGGKISANGEQGHHEENHSAKDGGGGGSGGSVYLKVETAALGSNLVQAWGGARSVGNLGGSNSAGGYGGYGRIAVYYKTSSSGSTDPGGYIVQQN